jgi:phosphoenolpyruvate phosphomutase
VRGFGKAAVAPVGVELFDNDRHAETGEIYSLAMAESRLSGEVLVSYGDILFRNYILTGLLATPGEIVVAVDALGQAEAGDGRVRDLAAGDRPRSPDYIDEPPPDLVEIGPAIPPDRVAGEWIGLARFSALGSIWLREEIQRLRSEGRLETADMPLLLTRLAARRPVKLYVFSGHWIGVDTLPDLAEARNFT